MEDGVCFTSSLRQYSAEVGVCHCAQECIASVFLSQTQHQTHNSNQAPTTACSDVCFLGRTFPDAGSLCLPGLALALQLFSPSSDPHSLLLLVGYEDGRAALWDTRSSREPLASTRLHEEPGGRMLYKISEVAHMV